MLGGGSHKDSNLLFYIPPVSWTEIINPCFHFFPLQSGNPVQRIGILQEMHEYTIEIKDLVD